MSCLHHGCLKLSTLWIECTHMFSCVFSPRAIEVMTASPSWLTFVCSAILLQLFGFGCGRGLVVGLIVPAWVMIHDAGVLIRNNL